MNQPLTPTPGAPSPVPDWKLERFLLGELPAAEARRLDAALAADAALARRLDALRAEHQAIKASHPADAMAQGIAARLRRTEGAPGLKEGSARASVEQPSWISRWLPQPRVWGPAFAMILVLALLPFTPYSPFARRDGGSGDAGAGVTSTERLKGLKPRLLLHRKLAEGSVKIADGEALRSGDLIQVQYESLGRAQGAVLSLDAEGKVTRHFPEQGTRSATLQGGGPVGLGYAYELDDSPGWERFYFITSDVPFDLAPVEEALRRLHPGAPGVPGAVDSLSLPKDFGQTRFIVVKEPGT